MKFLLILLVFFALEAQAKVTELTLDLKRMPFNLDYLFPDQTDWDYETRLNFSGEIGIFFMDNKVTGRTYDNRYHYVSWGFDMGFRVTDWLDVVHTHLSQHAIDIYREKFPVTDSYGARLNFLDKK